MWDLLFPPFTDAKLKQIKAVGHFVFQNNVEDAKKYVVGGVLVGGVIMVMRGRR